MKIPKSRVEPWLADIIDASQQSRPQRITTGNFFKSLYYTGAADSTTAIYNKTYAHIDRLTSFLYSPTEVRFNIQFDYAEGPGFTNRAITAARHLTREFAEGDVDMRFAEALQWALIKGSAFIKLLWEHDGLSPYLVQPESMAVLNETVSGINRQEAFVHTSFVLPAQLARIVQEHPDKADIMKAARNAKNVADDAAETENSFFHQIVIGGTQPVATQGPTNPSGGIVNIVGGPVPMLDPKIARDLIRVDEVWVLDDDREDYTTFQMVRPDILIEGKYEHRNLCGIAGHHPFVQICAEPAADYFWGRSEIAGILNLQDLINKRLRDFQRIWRRQARPPRGFTGFTGMSKEKNRALDTPGGFVSEDNPNAKIQDLTPKMPEGAMQEFQLIEQMFDEMAGFQPVIQGRGEQGVRANVHAQTLVRSASGRLRDRALLVERCLEEVGTLAFRMLQAKDANMLTAKGGIEFLLSQMPEPFQVRVDSHSGSPAFSEDNKELAFALAKAGAIGPTDVILLTNPPLMDMLLEHAEAREQAEAKFAQEHPELAAKAGAKKHK